MTPRITEPDLTPMQLLDIECEALRERLNDVAQERTIVLRDIEAGKPGARSQLLANLASERAIRRMARDLASRVVELGKAVAS